MLRLTSSSWFVAAKCGSSVPWLAWNTIVSVSLLDFCAAPLACGCAGAVGAAAPCAPAGAVVGATTAGVGALPPAGAPPPPPPHAASSTANAKTAANRSNHDDDHLTIDLICRLPLSKRRERASPDAPAGGATPRRPSDESDA